MAVVIIKNPIAQEEYLAKYSMPFQVQKEIQGPIQTITKSIIQAVSTEKARGLEFIKKGQNIYAVGAYQ